MASQVTVRLVDDLDGSDATQSVEFVYKDKTYTLDLNDENASNLEEALAPYIAAAEKAGSAQSPSSDRGRRKEAPRSGGAGQARDYNPQEVRAWAQGKGIEIPVRGRIPSAVIEQYKASRT